MENNQKDEILREIGFVPEQIERLYRLRAVYATRERLQILAERRRLEFVRWLVATGRITDGLPVNR